MNAIDKRASVEASEIRGLLSQVETDSDYAGLLAGKRVVIVGPAETMIGEGRGCEIDCYDLVVRVNTAIEYMPFARELARDIGARTDILYLNNTVMIDRILWQEGVSHERFAGLCNDGGIRYLVSTNNDFTYDEHAHICYEQASAFNLFLKGMAIRSSLRMLFSTSAAARKMLGGYVARTGFLAILDLLCYPVSELSVAGMTFYHKGGHLFFKDHARELHPLKDHLGRDTNRSMLGHNSYLELEVMKKLTEVFAPKLKVDERLKELFEGCDIANQQ